MYFFCFFLFFFFFFFLFFCFFFFFFFFFFSSRRRHTRSLRDWSSDVCSSDLLGLHPFTVLPRSTSTTILRLPLSRRIPSASRYAAFISRSRSYSMRSEERRVGKECRFRWLLYDEK